MDSNDSAVKPKKIPFNDEGEKNRQSKFQFHNLPDVNRPIELFAIEIEVKCGQNLKGSFTMCSIELLSKLIEINMVVAVDLSELHSTLKRKHDRIDLEMLFK